MYAYLEDKYGTVFKSSNPELHNECKKLSKAEGERRMRENAIETLRNMLEPGDIVYTVLRHVSASGMSRRIDIYYIHKNHPQFITGYAAKALGWKWGDKAGIVVNGCGMDMGFHLVYSLSRVLFPQGFKDGQDNQKDGGYALRHEWL